MAQLARFAAAAALLALSSAAWAGPSKADEARAATLKKEADTLVHASKFREALDKYDESYALVPNPAIHYNKGRAFQSLGDFVSALDELEQFASTAPADLKAKVPHLDKMIADVASHVATLVVQCEVPGATVTLRGKTVGTTPMKPLRTTPGDASVTVSAPGYVAFSQDTTLTGGESTTIDANLHKAATEPTATATPEPTPFDAEKPPPTPAPVTTEKPPQPENGARAAWKTLAWVSGGIGVAALGTGLVFLGLAISDKSDADNHCPNKLCDATGRQSINEAWTFADVSTVLVIAGSVALALSLTSFIVTPKAAPVQARVFFGPGSAGIGGTF